MHQLMTDLHEGRRKSLPCGAGVGLLAVDAGGDLNLCHRFTGSELPTFGNVATGIDARAPRRLRRQGDRPRGHALRDLPHPQSVRRRLLSRILCALRRRRTTAPTTTATCCGNWVDFGVRVYADIQRHNPGFFTRHLEPRSAIA